MMQFAQELEQWNAVGLNAVHCAISANDALLVYHLGIRSVSDDHLETIQLLQSNIQTDESRGAVSHLRRILSQKNLVEYEDREFTFYSNYFF